MNSASSSAVLCLRQWCADHPWLVLCAVLCGQHLSLYWPHYAGVATFYKDFSNVYYPLTAFWTFHVAAGVFPEWVPYANMGLPFVLTMQSGIFYPLFWIFTLSDALPYSLHAANVFASLHVLAGVWGCVLYARLLGLSWAATAVVAVAFQFLGPLYGNAEHPDMVRAYIYMPWLFWAVHVLPEQYRLTGRQYLLPLILALFVTGAYQGNLIAHCFVLVVFCVLCWLRFCYQRPAQAGATTALYFRIFLLALLGLMLCAAYLWPTYELLDYQSRSDGAMGIKHFWYLSYWHTLVMQTHLEGVFFWPAMITAFITVPVFCLFFLLPWYLLKAQWPLVVVIVLSVLLAAGASLPPYRWLVEWMPMLGYSRVTSSDYRGLFCFLAILMAGKTFDLYLSGALNAMLRRRLLWVLGLFVFYLLVGMVADAVSQWPEQSAQRFINDHALFAKMLYVILLFHAETITTFDFRDWSIALLELSAVAGLLYFYRDHTARVVSGFIALQFFSGYWYLYATNDHWQFWQSSRHYYSGVDDQRSLPVVDISRHPQMQRPACGEASTPAAYLQGRYVCKVKDSMNVKPRVRVDQSPLLTEYLSAAGRPVLIDPEQTDDCLNHLAQQLQQGSSAYVQQIRYGLQDVRYQIHASEAFCFVDNDLYFSGWTGRIEGSADVVVAQEYCGALRSWCVPAGDYQLHTHYTTPRLREGAVLSLLAMLCYAGLLVWRSLRRRELVK